MSPNKIDYSILETGLAVRRKDASCFFTFPSGLHHPHPSTFTVVRRLGRAKEYSWKNWRGGSCETLINVSKSSGSYKDGLGLHYVACEESLEGNVPQSRIGGLGGNLAFHCQRDRYQKGRARLFIMVCSVEWESMGITGERLTGYQGEGKGESLYR